MMVSLDETHDPNCESWVTSANELGSDFPVQNLPFGVYRMRNSNDPFRICTAIGDQVFDLAAVDGPQGSTLNELAAAGNRTWRDLRLRLFAALTDQAKQSKLSRFLVPMNDVELGLPVACGDYTDFFTSWYHAYNAGILFKPDAPVTPNFKWLPIGYNGRASSVVSSGTDVIRPQGQRAMPGQTLPDFGPSAFLDYEAELGLVIGPGNQHGSAIPIDEAEDHIFGIVLLNDWSARDLQAWEYQPLGPFLSKGFATTISPWVVTMQALAPFRKPGFKRFDGDPEPMPHLESERNKANGHLGVEIETWLRPENCGQETRLASAPYDSSYWTPSQMIAHHSSNGCPLRPGDILGTGTISGPEPEQAGSLLELSKAGREPVILEGGAQRRALEDGDTITLRARCNATAVRSIGFGAATGRIIPAKAAT